MVVSSNDGDAEGESGDNSSDYIVYCHLVELCIQRILANKIIFCRNHGNLGPYFIASDTGLVHSAHIAPDVVSLFSHNKSIILCSCRQTTGGSI